jgi:hypothetical protein
MATNTKETTQTAAETPASGGSTYADSAKAMIDHFHDMSQEVPKFLIPADENANRKLVSTGTLPAQVIDKIVAMIEQRPLLTGNELGPNEIRDRVSYAHAYGPVPDEVDAFSSALRHSVLTALSEAGRAALTVYEVAKRESKRPESADLRPHVADIKRLLGNRFAGRSKTAKTTQPTPQAPTQSSSSAPTSSQPKVQSAASASGQTDVAETSPTSKQQ